MQSTHTVFIILCALVATPLVHAQSIERADELFGDNRFDDAAAIYRSLAEADPEHGAAWYGLARALHEGGHPAEAAAAYEKTIELGENQGRAMYHFARLSATSGDEAKALELLREAQQNRLAAPYQILVQTKEFQELEDGDAFQAIANAGKPCTAPEYTHFDFWIGEWDVETPAGQPAGSNRVSRIEGGCALREEWTSASGGTGTSLNTFNATTRKWQQFWVDAQGTVLELVGGLEESAMVLRSDPDVSPLNRITWTPAADGSVRQHWETSNDGGESWSTAFDGIYRKKEQP